MEYRFDELPLYVKGSLSVNAMISGTAHLDVDRHTGEFEILFISLDAYDDVTKEWYNDAIFLDKEDSMYTLIKTAILRCSKDIDEKIRELVFS